MNPTLPLWFLALQAGPMSAPSAHLASDLARLSAVWSVRFSEVRPIESVDPANLEPSEEAAQRIEALFDEARTAAGALRPDEAGAALERAEALLRSHAELPQSAWLMAEHHTLLADLLVGQDPEAALELRSAARALEGARARPFRDRPLSALEAPSGAALSLSVRGLNAQDTLLWDAELRQATLETAPGEHHVRVLRAGRFLWAGWVAVAADARSILLDLPPIIACSADDLGATRDGALGPVPSRDVQCRQWASAKIERAELWVALCHRDACGQWHRAPLEPDPFRPPAQHVERAHTQRWVLYGAAGAGVALVAGAVLFAAGVFTPNARERERWVYTGVQ